jgi:hypothetical protein
MLMKKNNSEPVKSHYSYEKDQATARPLGNNEPGRQEFSSVSEESDSFSESKVGQ